LESVLDLARDNEFFGERITDSIDGNICVFCLIGVPRSNLLELLSTTLPPSTTGPPASSVVGGSQ
jgi:hypothetical protein